MPARILVVDDSSTIRRVVSAILERHGYEAALASDGEDAMQALASGEVKADLILLDFVMPRMNGYQFCRALRANTELANTPVVLMSARGDRIRDQFVQQTGAVDAITKPFDAQALVTVVENAIHRVKSGRASSARLPVPTPRVLPEVASLEPESTPDSQPDLEPETKRTHVAQIVANKLAQLATRALVEKPAATPGEIAQSIAERLAGDAIVEMVEVVKDLEGARSKSSYLSGDLAVIPIGAVLQLLGVEKQTGVLHCRHGGAEIIATFNDGLIQIVQSTGAGDEFRLGRFFVEEGVLKPEEIDEVMRRSRPDEPPASRISKRPAESGGYPVSKSPDTLREDPQARVTIPNAGVAPSPALGIDARPRLLGALLLDAKKITEEQLASALVRQSSELLYEVIRWPKGRFDFRRDTGENDIAGAKLALPVATVVMEGFRRVDEWRDIERTVGSFDTVLVRDDLALGSIDKTALPPKEFAILDAVDGERAVRGIIAASHMSSFDACRILAQFLAARILRRRTT